MADESGRILLVIAPYYEDIAAELERGARRALAASGYAVDRLEVPGAFEIPAAIAAAARGRGYAGYVALGCVIRGETSHYDHVCQECARGLMALATRDGLAVGFGVLTVESHAQALERARVDGRDKGGEAARAALAMIAVQGRFPLAPGDPR
jgi:6,7-dimethyl-8-ribityllumazine synthase